MCPTGTTAHRPDTQTGSDFRSAFDVLDADRDGKISPSDLKTFYKGFSGGGAEEDDGLVWFDFLKKIWEIFSTNKFSKVIKPNKFSQKNFSKLVNQTSFPNKSLSHTYQINHFFQNSLSKSFFKTSFEKNQTKHVFVLFISKTYLSNTNQTYPDVIGSMMSAADSNKDGFVEYDEFETVLNERNGGGGSGRGVMEEAFRVMDRDGDGLVGEEDLRGYFHLAGFDASDEEIKAMIRLGGGDENRGVSYDAFLKILAVS